jgi:hypothetical protein
MKMTLIEIRVFSLKCSQSMIMVQWLIKVWLNKVECSIRVLWTILDYNKCLNMITNSLSSKISNSHLIRLDKDKDKEGSMLMRR